MLSILMTDMIPMIIKNFIDESSYAKVHGEVFEVILNKLLTSGTLKDDSTKQFVLDSLLDSVRNEDHYKQIVKWFERK